MSSDPEGPPPPPQSELSPERCPNCGRPLKFPENRPEGLCAACGIYVEILKPLPPPRAPPIDRTAVQTSLKRDLIRMCEERGLDASGSKADLVRRLLDEAERSSQTTTGTPEPPEGAPEVEDVAKRRETALFHLNLEQALEEPEEQPAPARPPEPPRPAVEAAAAPQPAAAVEPPPPPGPPLPELPRPTEPPPLPGPPAPADTPPVVAEAEATFPPEFDELFADEEPVPTESPAEPPGPPPEEEPEESGGPGILELTRAEPLSSDAEDSSRVDEDAVLSARMRRDRIFFYVGLLAIVFGGVGLLLGSFVHDLLRVPMFGGNYDVFGSLNATAAAIGGGFLVAGLCAVLVSFRGGITRARTAPGA